MNLKIDLEVLRILDDAKISWNDYLILQSKLEISPLYSMYAKKLLAFEGERENMLIRRGFLDKEGTPTKQTTDLFGGKVLRASKVIKSNMDLIKEGFDKFWNTYPSSDKYLHWGRTRILRRNKAKTFKLYTTAVRDYSIEQLQQCIEADIEMHKKGSKTENKFKFFPLITTWFQEKQYEGLIDDLVEVVDKSSNKNNNRYEGEIS